MLLSKSAAACLVFLRFFSCVLALNCNFCFQTQPKDVVVREGDDAFFICKVSNVNLMTDSLTWELNPKRYRILVSKTSSKLTNEITSVLTVLNVGREEQTQTCVLNYMDDNFLMKSCESRVARLAIQYFPRADEIRCGPNGDQAFNENEISSMWCKVSHGNPVVHLKWNFHIENVQVLSRRDGLLKNELVSTIEVNVTRLLHSKMIECLVTSDPPYRDETISCTIGSVTVLYKPNLHVSPSYMSIQSNNTDDLKINCSGDGNPSVREILWICIPPSDRCRNETGRTLTIAMNESTPERSGNISVTCSASNSVGEANVTTVISFQDSYTETKTKLINCRNISLEAMDIANFAFVCMVHCIESSGDEIVRVRWYFNERIVKEDEKSPNEEGITEFYFILGTFFSTTQSNVLICNATVHHNSGFVRQSVSIGVHHPKKHISPGYDNKQAEVETDFFNGSWSAKRSKDSTTTSRVMARFGQTADVLPIQDNVTLEHSEKHFILFSIRGIVGTAFAIAFMFVIGLIVIYKIIRDKVRLSINDMMEAPSNMQSINDSCQSVAPCRKIVNNDSDYEEPLQSINGYFNHFKEQDNLSFYEMSVLTARSSVHSQTTNYTSGSDSYQCCSMSEGQCSCSSLMDSKQASEDSYQTEVNYEEILKH